MRIKAYYNVNKYETIYDFFNKIGNTETVVEHLRKGASIAVTFAIDETGCIVFTNKKGEEKIIKFNTKYGKFNINKEFNNMNINGFKMFRAETKKEKNERRNNEYLKQVKDDFISLKNLIKNHDDKILISELSELDVSKKNVKKILQKEIEIFHSMKEINAIAKEFKDAGKPSGINFLYHGTRVDNIENIIKKGFKLSCARKGGMLGKGIYCGEKQKARNYGDFIFKVAVCLGNCKRLSKLEQINKQTEYDSFFAPSGTLYGVNKGFLYNSEYVIRDERQIVAVSIFVRETLF